MVYQTEEDAFGAQGLLLFQIILLEGSGTIQTGIITVGTKT